jgi:hypothetical protein
VGRGQSDRAYAAAWDPAVDGTVRKKAEDAAGC